MRGLLRLTQMAVGHLRPAQKGRRPSGSNVTSTNGRKGMKTITLMQKEFHSLVPLCIVFSALELGIELIITNDKRREGMGVGVGKQIILEHANHDENFININTIVFSSFSYL